MANDWADGEDLAAISRSTNPLSAAGYDPDELRANPQLRAQVMAAVQSPYGLSALRAPGANPTVGPPAPTARPMTSSTTLTPGATPSRSATTSGAATSGPSTRPMQPATSPIDAAGQQALNKGLSLAGFAQHLAQEDDSQPQTAALENRIAQESAPTPYEDASGKPLPQFREGAMGRVGRGLKAAALGLVEGGLPGLVAGAVDPALIAGGMPYGAPNAAYQAAEGQRQGSLQADQAQLSNIAARFKAATDARKASADALKVGVTAAGNVGKDARSLQPKEEKPAPYLIDGQPGYATFDPQKGWVNQTPGPQFGQPVSGKLVPYTPPARPAAEKATPVLIDGRPGFAVQSPKGWVDVTGNPITGRVTPVPTRSETAGAAGTPGTPGNAGLTGDAYLATLPAGLASTVRAIGEGREAPPSAGNRSKAAMEILNAVNQAYPGYDATQYQTYASARRAFTSGPIGTAINAFNTALHHLDRMESNLPKGNGRFETLNALENRMAASGSQRAIDLGRYKTDANAVANEVQKAYKGGVVNQDEYNQMLQLLNPNASPAQMQSNLGELRQLLHGKLESYRQQWSSQGPPGMAMPAPGIETPRPGAASQGGTQPAAADESSRQWAAQFPKAN